MSEPHTSDTSVNLGATKEIARRLDIKQRIVDRFVELGERGMASGVVDGFDIDEFIDEMRVDADSATS